MPDTLTIEARVRAMLYDILGGYQGVNFGPDFPWESRLVEDLGADSLDLVEIAMNLDDEFDITVSDEKVDAWRTAGDILASVEAERVVR